MQIGALTLTGDSSERHTVFLQMMVRGLHFMDLYCFTIVVYVHLLPELIVRFGHSFRIAAFVFQVKLFHFVKISPFTSTFLVLDDPFFLGS